MSDRKLVHWVGPVKDRSGYGTATRNYILSILETNRLALTVQSVSFEQIKTTHSALPLIEPYIKGDQGAFVRVIHLTPENYSRFYKSGCYNIAYTVWETDKLPPRWIPELNRMNEIWVPSDYNVEIFKRSGLTCPILKIPHAIPVPEIETIPIVSYPGDHPGLYWFYSIFQWLSRKNPHRLLVAYLTEFQNHHDVVLALKTYRNGVSVRETEIIKQEIAAIKRTLNFSTFPQILLFSHVLTSTEILQLHKRGDCFVMVPASEGFGQPFAEAMALGKPVIGSDYSGPKEFIQHQKNGLLVSYCETPVHGMTWMPLYTADMVWGEPDIMSLRKMMRWMYEHRDEAKILGEQAKQDIKNRFSYAKIGELITSRIEQIYKEQGR